MIEVLILSILQGIAEFLPISSSGHLVLGKSLLGLGDTGLRLDIFLHVGTLFSICIFYFGVIKRILCGRDWSYMFKIALSAVPAGLVGILLKDWLEALFASPKAVGAALLFTGVVLCITKFMPKKSEGVSWWKAIVIGVAQAIAIIPGVSRSGMTIATARCCGVQAEKCAEFSFLMSIPPIAGAALLEVLKSFKAVTEEGMVEVSWGYALLGMVVAGVVGYFALALLLKSLKSRGFWWFGPYCFIAGLITIFVA